ncbi:MAG: LytTR family DNA-binding domain-containing protein [Ferruginibacter sp.]
MILTCMIVDDEPLAHKVLLDYIKRTDMLLVEKQAFSAAEAREYLSIHTIDILFLDIEMPEETGVALLRSLPQKPVTIFTTAYINYSLEGFELGVIDYLVKPMRYERFQTAVKRAADFIELYKLKSNIESENNKNDSLLIKTGKRRKTIGKNQITHIQALKDYVIIYCSEEKYVVRSTMKEMEGLMGTADFIRVHKSFIITKQKAKFYGGGKIEFNGFEIPVGRKYRKDIDDLLK